MEGKSILPDFHAFLRSRKIVPGRNIPYLAHWVSKFLHYSNNNKQLDHKKLVMEFIDALQKNNAIPDWQIRQTWQAVQIYLVNFKGKKLLI
jgi:hypothetical protein